MDYIKILQIAFLVLTIITLLGGLTYALITFLKMPKSKQGEKVKEWLLFACAKAEQLYGSKTGLLKLRYVYDMFVTKFPWLAQIISFEYFSDLVDEALESMKRAIETNTAIKNTIIGADNNELEKVIVNE